MADYTATFLAPDGSILWEHDFSVLTVFEDEGEGKPSIDEMSAFMMDEGNTKQWDVVRRAIPGGYDARAPYSIRIEKKVAK